MLKLSGYSRLTWGRGRDAPCPHSGGPGHQRQSSTRGIARSAQTNAGLWEPPLVASDRRTSCSFQPTAPLADTDGHLRSSRGRAILECDAQADVPLAEASGATCVQRLDDSRDSAIHTKYRISLHSSSWREPRYPLPRVVISLCFFSFVRPRRTRRWIALHSFGFLRCAVRTRVLGVDTSRPPSTRGVRRRALWCVPAPSPRKGGSRREGDSCRRTGAPATQIMRVHPS